MKILEVPASWREIVGKYAQPRTSAALFQLITTIPPLIVLIVAMYLLVPVHFGLVALLMLPTAGLMVRTFIIMHDCGHGSFLGSRRWNDIIGFITGVLTLTPYVHWRKEHAIHHATSGDLDRRGFGDITTLTVKEYLALSWWGRLKYRIYRNPIALLGFGPVWLAFKHRFPGSAQAFGPKERLSVFATDSVIIAALIVASLCGVLHETLVIYLPTALLASAMGIWLFYVQHQFDGTYWEHSDDWNYATAALHGSTYLKLPKVLQWFTGNIGLHHIHHLSPKIPNYSLQRCHDENPLFQVAPTIGFKEGIRALFLKLWCEDTKRLITFGELSKSKRSPQAASHDGFSA